MHRTAREREREISAVQLIIYLDNRYRFTPIKYPVPIEKEAW
jgi:hypothetical protein